MKNPARLLILLACGFLLAVFFVPLWHIHLDAPQYPGGLDMYIWINKITGTDEFTLQNINILNHYIGMQAIHPDSFKELEIMPHIVACFIVMGLATAFFNKKKLIVAWVAFMIIGGTIGLVDFYLWQQAFGTQLNPDAPIKIEGMSYSPPFLGVKTLLNITASSFPHWGGVFFGLALALGIGTILSKTRKKVVTNASVAKYSATIAACLVLFTSCQPKPQAIEFGFDACTHCKMTIADNRYGSELVTSKGKVYKFDAIECLIAFQDAFSERFAFQLVTNYSNPGEFIDATGAWYLQSPSLPSPMGMNLTAFHNENAARAHARELGGKVMDWGEVKSLRIGSVDTRMH